MQLPNMQGRSPIFHSEIKQKEIKFIISILDIPEDKTLLIEYKVFYFIFFIRTRVSTARKLLLPSKSCMQVLTLLHAGFNKAVSCASDLSRDQFGLYCCCQIIQSDTYTLPFVKFIDPIYHSTLFN